MCASARAARVHGAALSFGAGAARPAAVHVRLQCTGRDAVLNTIRARGGDARPARAGIIRIGAVAADEAVLSEGAVGARPAAVDVGLAAVLDAIGAGVDADARIRLADVGRGAGRAGRAAGKAIAAAKLARSPAPRASERGAVASVPSAADLTLLPARGARAALAGEPATAGRTARAARLTVAAAVAGFRFRTETEDKE